MIKPELIAPAGNLEKLKIAFIYGADAVYLAGKRFGLRAKAGNFTLEEMEEGLKFAQNRGKKVYVTLNIIPHNTDFIGLEDYLNDLQKIGIDGVIVADPGILSVVRKSAPSLKIALSTQANNTNYLSANFWYENNVSRIVVARELSINEIKEIVQKTPNDLQIETFVHGAMCISYSGRCLLSNYMTQRDSNQGDCSHPCRWNYTLMEQTRENEYYPIHEDQRGTYIYNSKDLCLIEHIPELIDAGVSSMKIEGRMKSIFYVATVVSVYRKVIDEYCKNPDNYTFNNKWFEELKKVSHREYTKGFAFEKPDYNEQNYKTTSYVRLYDFAGIVIDYDPISKLAIIEQRNRVVIGDEIEIMGPNRDYFIHKVQEMWDVEDNLITTAPHPKQIFKLRLEKEVKPFDILRKKHQ